MTNHKATTNKQVTEAHSEPIKCPYHPKYNLDGWGECDMCLQDIVEYGRYKTGRLARIIKQFK